MVTYIVIGSIVFSILFTVLMLVLSFKLVKRLTYGSKEKQEQAAELVKTGSKGRAQIVSIAPTGMVVNEIYIRTVLRFQISPLDGSQPFDGEKKMLIDQTNQPRIGDIWPCWYDRLNPATFAVGKPGGDARDQIDTWREFGIPHPLDR